MKPASSFWSGFCVVIAVSAAIVACLPSVMGVPTTADTALYAGEQLDCVDRADSAAQAHACRAESRAKWCARWPQSVNCGGLDGGR